MVSPSSEGVSRHTDINRQRISHEAQRMAKCKAAAPKSTSLSEEVRRSFEMSAKKGCIRAGSPIPLVNTSLEILARTTYRFEEQKEV